MAVELGADQIRVNLIAPDTSPARGSNGALYPDDFKRLAEVGPDALGASMKMYVPQRQAPSVEDITNGVLFLVSDLARAVTGTTLHVDGGTIAALGFLDWPYGDSFMPAPLGGTLSHLFPKSKV
jgi:enoyl-[acyl-carrier-protein] reductase (NADH)